MLNLATALVAVGALYFLLTERVLPLLQSEPVRVHEGGTLTESFAFRPLGMERPKTVDLRHIPDEWPVLLLVFNSTCPACYANLPAWRRAIDAAGRRVTVLAVAIESDRSAAQSYATRELPRALAVEPVEPMELTGTLGIDVVPYTALVGTGGSLEFSRPGRLDSADVASLTRALGGPGGHPNP
ncbi:MAG: hypothetical protein V3U38_08085 [Gemmatimonadota bacterium]|jgi:hypothetical protein